ncbi:MAG: AEC family transporter [Clostridia bacterium]|nr:AEC family transporter [Clostridia bacterium]
MAKLIPAIMNPMLVLFLCMALGFLLHKIHILPDSAGQVMAKLETYVFCPALSFGTMATFFTPKTIKAHATNLVIGILLVSLAVFLSLLLVRFFARKKSKDWGVYAYALAFANGGYMGDPLVQMILGSSALSYYKLFYLPINSVIFTWGISILVPDNGKKTNPIKKILNVPTVAMLAGMAVGITGAVDYIPSFCMTAMNSLSSCMGPVAMLLAGFTVASYPFGEILKNKKVYVVSLLRLIILPTLLITELLGIKTLGNLLFDLNINNNVLHLAFFAFATPLGMNTIVFPEAYGGDSKTGASMALISHTLCVLSIPIMYAILCGIFGGYQVL